MIKIPLLDNNQIIPNSPGSIWCGKSNIVLGLQIHCTSRCFQCCIHCYMAHDRVKSYLKGNDLKSIIIKFKSYCNSIHKIPFISLTGGDIFLRDDVWDILDFITENKIRFEILGNPDLINQDLAKKLKKYNPYAFQLSLDGLLKIHDFIRKEGSFNQTLNAIKFLNDAGIKTRINMVVSQLNKNDTIGVIHQCVASNVKQFVISRYCPIENNNQLTIIPPNEYFKFLDEVYNEFLKLSGEGTDFILKDPLRYIYLLETHKIKTESLKGLQFGCGMETSNLSVLPSGELYSCATYESSIGSLLDYSFDELLKNLEASRDIEGCENCKYYKLCQGGCHAISSGENKSPFKKDPQCRL